jgi:hypothetical protein
LRAHHAQVAARLATEELSWTTLAEALSREGLRGRNGVELTGRAVAQVWRRVCRDVEQVALSAEPRERKYPSRISADWRPQVVEQTQPAPSIGQRARSSPKVPGDSVFSVAGAGQNSEILEFPTVDPSGVGLPDGHVFYRGRSMLRRVAEQLAKIDRQAREMDRFK